MLSSLLLAFLPLFVAAPIAFVFVATVEIYAQRVSGDARLSDALIIGSIGSVALGFILPGLLRIVSLSC